MRGERMRIGFVGAGRAGSALALALAQSGEAVVAAASRDLRTARSLADRIPGCRAVGSAQEAADGSDLVFLTVPDDAIGPLVESLFWRTGVAVVHCSGAAGREILEPAGRRGAETGAFHPLQTFPSVGAMARLDGCTFAVEAEPPLLRELTRLAEGMGGRALALPAGSRPLYHTSATLASNFLVALLAGAAGLWAKFGLSPEQAVEALLPLVRSTIDNVGRLGPRAALTGPIARGDVGTVRRQVEALRTAAPDMIGLYRELALLTVEIAFEKGTLTAALKEQLKALLTELGGPD
ncbi:MAG: DUF2520 domain-containing protein [Chloroflexota bacterium]|nr:DUF2520 domain-containing protein [Chloroflexota bacterium]